MQKLNDIVLDIFGSYIIKWLHVLNRLSFLNLSELLRIIKMLFLLIDDLSE